MNRQQKIGVYISRVNSTLNGNYIDMELTQEEVNRIYNETKDYESNRDMKAIDELIEKYEGMSKTLSNFLVIQNLEQLKEQLKEQHKKDVLNAYSMGAETVKYSSVYGLVIETSAEQYYQQTYE